MRIGDNRPEELSDILSKAWRWRYDYRKLQEIPYSRMIQDFLCNGYKYKDITSFSATPRAIIFG
jgi:hypothetical protein